jgi:hypothetical protein
MGQAWARRSQSRAVQDRTVVNTVAASILLADSAFLRRWFSTGKMPVATLAVYCSASELDSAVYRAYRACVPASPPPDSLRTS